MGQAVMKPLLARYCLVVLSCPLPLAGQVLAWDRIGTQLPNRSFMDSQIESVGDANGDGYPDLMMIVPVNGDPELWLLSGKDGATLRKRPALATLRHYTNICGIGDCDGDGEPDYLLVTQDRSGAAGPNIFQARRVRDDALLWPPSRIQPLRCGAGLYGVRI